MVQEFRMTRGEGRREVERRRKRGSGRERERGLQRKTGAEEEDEEEKERWIGGKIVGKGGWIDGWSKHRSMDVGKQ